MRAFSARPLGRAFLGASLFLCVVASQAFLASPASAASFPRRVAIAPFVSLAKEDIGATVALLPRLLASRLMALAGADVLLLPAGGKSPEEAAKEAKYPLLLQGTVSKLGKGYSIDTSVTDLSTGASAGAFFAAAATEDDIIPQLGVLSGEIAEKLFGVQGAARPVAPPPAPAAAPVSPLPGAAAVVALPAAAATSQAPAPAPSAPPPAPAPLSTPEGWTPSALKKVGQSDKIADEIHGVVTGDVDAAGDGEVITYGRHVIYVYRVKGTEVLPYTRVSRGIDHHFLHVDAIDLDGDGKKDLVVTDLVGDRLDSFVLLRQGDGFAEVPGTVPYYLVVLREGKGKTVLAGQRGGVGGDPFQGKIRRMKWDGKALSEGDAFPLDTAILPLSGGGVLSLAPVRFGNEDRWLYVDMEERLRVLDAGGKSIYKSKDRYGAPSDGFQYGEINRMSGRRPMMSLRRPPRAIPWGKGESLVLVTDVRKGTWENLTGAYEAGRVVLLQWEGSGFSERASSPKSDFFYSGVDVLEPGDLGKGGRFISSVVEQRGSDFKDKASRLVLMQVE